MADCSKEGTVLCFDGLLTGFHCCIHSHLSSSTTPLYSITLILPIQYPIPSPAYHSYQVGKARPYTTPIHPETTPSLRLNTKSSSSRHSHRIASLKTRQQRVVQHQETSRLPLVTTLSNCTSISRSSLSTTHSLRVLSLFTFTFTYYTLHTLLPSNTSSFAHCHLSDSPNRFANLLFNRLHTIQSKSQWQISSSYPFSEPFSRSRRDMSTSNQSVWEPLVSSGKSLQCSRRDQEDSALRIDKT